MKRLFVLLALMLVVGSASAAMPALCSAAGATQYKSVQFTGSGALTNRVQFSNITGITNSQNGIMILNSSQIEFGYFWDDNATGWISIIHELNTSAVAENYTVCHGFGSKVNRAAPADIIMNSSDAFAGGYNTSIWTDGGATISFTNGTLKTHHIYRKLYTTDTNHGWEQLFVRANCGAPSNLCFYRGNVAGASYSGWYDLTANYHWYVIAGTDLDTGVAAGNAFHDVFTNRTAATATGVWVDQVYKGAVTADLATLYAWAVGAGGGDQYFSFFTSWTKAVSLGAFSTLVVYPDESTYEWKQDGPTVSYELSNATFTLNITNASITTLSNVMLSANGVNYSNMTYSAGAGQYNFTTTIFVPLVTTNNTPVTWSWFYTRDGVLKNTTAASDAVYYAYWPANFTASPSTVMEYEPFTAWLGFYNSSALATVTSNHSLSGVSQNATQVGNYFRTSWTSGSKGTYTLNSTLNISYNGTSRFPYMTATVTVAQVYLTACGDGNSTALNFTAQDEENFTNLAFSMPSTFVLWNSARTHNQTYSFNFTGVINATVCIYPNTTALVDSFQSYSALTSYPMRSYFLWNASISNVTSNFTLFLLPTAVAKTTKVTLYDNTFVGVPGAFLDFMRYYPATNTYQTVAMILTDSNGEGNTYLRPNDAWFKIADKENGTAYEFSSQTVPCDPGATLCELTLTKNAGNYDEFAQYYGKTASSCSYVNTTHMLTCTVSDTSSLMHSVNFYVYKINPFGITTVCNQTVATSSVSFACDLTGVTGDVHYGVTARYTNTELLYEGWITPGLTALWDPTVGVLMALLMVFLLAGVGMWDPGVAIGFGVVAVGVSWSLGLILVSLGTIFGIFVVAAVAISQAKR